MVQDGELGPNVIKYATMLGTTSSHRQVNRRVTTYATGPQYQSNWRRLCAAELSDWLPLAVPVARSRVRGGNRPAVHSRARRPLTTREFGRCRLTTHPLGIFSKFCLLWHSLSTVLNSVLVESCHQRSTRTLNLLVHQCRRQP